MTVNIVLLLVLILSLVQFAVLLRKMEADRVERTRTLSRLEEDHTRMKAVCDGMGTVMKQAEETLAEANKELDKLKELREVAELELKALEEQPKQRLFVFDKNTIVHAKLWEVTVSNDQLIKAPKPGPTAQEWAAGRICVVGAATDRDARQRVESRFATSLGYRVVGVKRFRKP